MICKNCGAKNSDKRNSCFNCGTPFVSQEDYFPQYEEDNISDGQEILPVRKKSIHCEQDSTPLRRKPVSPVQNTEPLRRKPVSPVQDNESLRIKPTLPEQDTAPSKKKSTVYGDTVQMRKGSAQNSNTQRNRQNTKPQKKKSNAGINALISVLAVLGVAVICGMGILVYNGFIKPETPDSTPSELDKINLTKPEITKLTDSDGKEYLHGVFNGKIGDRLYLGCNDTYHTFVEEIIELDLYLEDLFSSDRIFTENTVNANIDAYIVRDNRRYACGTPTCTLSVPKAEYEFVSPDSQSFKVYNDKFTIRIWTLPNSTVLLNGRDVTSSMTGLGLLQTEVEIAEGAKDTYKLQITQPYHTPVNDAFLLYRDPSVVDLSVSAYSADIISGNQVTVSGSTEEGVEISCDLPLLSVEKNELYNTFTAKIDLSDVPYGLVSTKIQGTSSEGTTVRSYTFWYWPDEKSVTTSSKTFTEAVASNPAAHSGTYVINDVKVEKVIGAGKFLGTVTVGANEYSYIFSCDYDRGNAVVGSTYKVFARYISTNENSVPVYRVWYMY